MKPDDVPQWAWDEALPIVTKITPAVLMKRMGDRRIELVARAILKARSQAYEELRAALVAKKYIPSQGMDAEMEAFNDGLHEAIALVSEGMKDG